MFSGRPFLRSLVLLLAISATLLVSTIAASPAHFHKDNYGGCDLCAIAHLPVVQPVLTAHVFVPAMSKLRVTVQAAARPSDPFVQLESTRGPPHLHAVIA